MEELINESINGTNIEKVTDSNPGALEKSIIMIQKMKKLEV